MAEEEVPVSVVVQVSPGEGGVVCLAAGVVIFLTGVYY